MPLIGGINMGSHYVPRKYLRGFCETGSDQWLWEYSKELNKFRRKTVGAVAQERGFYSEDVETKLNQLVEMPANEALDRIRTGAGIDAKDREHLALYIATMITRVPRSRNRAAAAMPQVLAETVNEVKALISQAKSTGDLDPSIAARRLAEADAAEDRFKESPPPQIEELIVAPWPTADMVQRVWEMTWRFVWTDGPSYFLTSDNPAFFFDGFGLGRSEAELTFPLSSTLALHGSWVPTAKIGIIPAPQDLVKEFNRRLACGSTRFIYYRERKDWIASLAKRSNQASLNRILPNHWRE
jgi:Protein of unknown function (DUF4238)